MVEQEELLRGLTAEHQGQWQEASERWTANLQEASEAIALEREEYHARTQTLIASLDSEAGEQQHRLTRALAEQKSAFEANIEQMHARMAQEQEKISIIFSRLEEAVQDKNMLLDAESQAHIEALEAHLASLKERMQSIASEQELELLQHFDKHDAQMRDFGAEAKAKESEYTALVEERMAYAQQLWQNLGEF